MEKKYARNSRQKAEPGSLDEDRVWHKDVSGARLWVNRDGAVWLGLLDDFGHGNEIVVNSSLCIATGVTDFDELTAALAELRSTLVAAVKPQPGPGDVVRINGVHLRHGNKAVVLRLLPKGTHAEVRIVGHEPRPGEVYPAYPLADLELVERAP